MLKKFNPPVYICERNFTILIILNFRNAIFMITMQMIQLNGIYQYLILYLTIHLSSVMSFLKIG